MKPHEIISDLEYKLHTEKGLKQIYLAERDAADRIRPVDERLQRSRVWLDKYLAPNRKRPTGFNWAPRWPVKPPGDDNGKKIIEGEFTELADADAASEGRGQGGQAEGGSGAAQGSLGHAQGDARDFETPF